MKTYDTLESNSIACSTSYTLTADADVRFGTLKNCYTDMGYTDACATLWAHSAATGASKCIDFCFPDSTLGYTVLNGPPPACEAEACLTCTNIFYADFEVISGRTLQNSGISERIARACSVFYPVEHDACVGSTERVVLPVATTDVDEFCTQDLSVGANLAACAAACGPAECCSLEVADSCLGTDLIACSTYLSCGNLLLLLDSGAPSNAPTAAPTAAPSAAPTAAPVPTDASLAPSTVDDSGAAFEGFGFAALIAVSLFFVNV